MLYLMKCVAAPHPEALDALRSAVLGAGFQSGLEEPSWEHWVAPLALPSESASALVSSLRLLGLLPFADRTALTDLLLFRHSKLLQVRAHSQARGDSQSQRLCSLCELKYDLFAAEVKGTSEFADDWRLSARTDDAQIRRYLREGRNGK